jgi:hypothetical protein
MVERLLNWGINFFLKAKTLNEPSSQIKQSFKATHLNFLLPSTELYWPKCNHLAMWWYLPLSQTNNWIWAILFGAKDGFTLVLGGYLVWPLRLPLLWFQLPRTKSQQALDFWNWNPNAGLKLDPVLEQKLEPRPGSRTDTRSGTRTKTQF